MITTWAFTGVRWWTLAVVGVWLLATSLAPAQTLRGPPGTSRPIIVSATINNPFPPPAKINIVATGIPNMGAGTNLAVPAKFLGFATQQALLPGAPQIPALNNGSLQQNIGNIASLPLGDRLQMNGVQFDPDLIDSINGGMNGNNNGNNNGNGVNGQPGNGQLFNGQPVVGGFRAARAQAMMASAYQAQQNWYLQNLYRTSALLKSSSAANPGFGSLFNTGSYLPSGSFGLTSNSLTGASLNTDPSLSVAFNGFSKSTSDTSGVSTSSKSEKSDKSDLPDIRTLDKPNTDKP